MEAQCKEKMEDLKMLWTMNSDSEDEAFQDCGPETKSGLDVYSVDKRNFIWIKIGVGVWKHRVVALVDSGASTTFVSAQLLGFLRGEISSCNQCGVFN